jgi:hypothetical protein
MPSIGDCRRYVSQRTDGLDRWVHHPPGHWAHDLLDRQGGEICIEHGETTFCVDDLRILRANAVRSALDASRQKT